MCDTFVALGNSTQDGSVLFAKNSDRQPNEPHVMIRVPRRRYGRNSMLKTTYITIPQVEETYEVMFLKPSWIWGCEMGCNEFGLNIGNEAVFTKEKYGPPALLGMDMARIALERCRNTEEAVDLIVDLLKTYGQGGNCGFEKPFTYHNSFLIADQDSAWVLETAGQYWAAKRVADIYCISNCPTIGADFDKCHPALVKHAIAKGWCRNEKEFSFRDCYTNHLITNFSGANERLASCRSILEKEKGRITIDTMKRALRAHAPRIEGKQFRKSSLKSVCMHGGGLIGDHTTGSYIASLGKRLCTYWVTGASTPCISVFKPVWLVENAPIFLEGEETAAVEYWKLRERFHRLVMTGRIDLGWFLGERDRLEERFSLLVEGINPEKTSAEELAGISKTAFTEETVLINEAIGRAKRELQKLKPMGNWYFNRYWSKQNRNL